MADVQSENERKGSLNPSQLLGNVNTGCEGRPDSPKRATLGNIFGGKMVEYRFSGNATRILRLFYKR